MVKLMSSIAESKKKPGTVGGVRDVMKALERSQQKVCVLSSGKDIHIISAGCASVEKHPFYCSLFDAF